MKKPSSIFFRDARCSFGSAEEFAARFTSSVVFFALALGTAALLAAPRVSSRALGALLAVFLLDLLLHLRDGDRALGEFGGSLVNVARACAPASLRILRRALRRSRATAKNFPLLFLRELARNSEVRESLRRLDVVPDAFAKELDVVLASEEGAVRATPEDLLKNAEALAVRAYHAAIGAGERFIEPRNFFAALAADSAAPLPRLLGAHEITPEDAAEAAVFGRFRRTLAGVRRLPAVLGGFAYRHRAPRARAMNRAWTARPTPVLDSFSTDLTNLARDEKVGFLIGHEKEFEHLLEVLARPGKPNALLVGEPGVGKSTMIAHLAFRIIKDQVPPALFDKRLVELNAAALAGDAAPEVAAGRIKAIVGEILAAGNIVLAIPRTHELFRRQEGNGTDPVGMLLPVLASEAIPVIAETFPREFKRIVEPRADFMERFETVEVSEITPMEATRFLAYSSLLLEREFGLTVTFRAVRKAVALARRYFTARVLPGSALDLLKQAFARAREEGARELTEAHVVAVAERQSKVPIETAGLAEAEKLLNLEAVIHERLVNQSAAVTAVARALREYRSGLSRKGGPIATFLFVGPTGVGKTELAKILAKAQFGSSSAMHRFDMSEYQTKDSVGRLIGTLDGARDGSLTDAVRAAPYSLVLLDEFEKAHPDILNLFLQVFDDGRLTDSAGRTADFTNVIIIATSNAHSDFIKEEIEKGKTSEEVAEELKRRLTAYFKPELLNRFSGISVFRSLTEEEIRKIAALLLGEVTATLREAHGVDLAIGEDAVREIARLGWSPVFGARPLRQVISERVRGPLAEKILRREFARSERYSLGFKDGVLVFEKL